MSANFAASTRISSLPVAGQRLRTTMAAVRVMLRWFGARKTLTPDQKAQAAESFGAEGDFLSARKKLLDTRHPSYKDVTAVRGRVNEPGLIARPEDVARPEVAVQPGGRFGRRGEVADAVKHRPYGLYILARQRPTLHRHRRPLGRCWVQCQRVLNGGRQAHHDGDRHRCCR